MVSPVQYGHRIELSRAQATGDDVRYMKTIRIIGFYSTKYFTSVFFSHFSSPRQDLQSTLTINAKASKKIRKVLGKRIHWNFS